jgi:hypothetical protein
MRNITAEWITRGQALQMHVGVEGSVEVQLDVGGTLDTDRRGLEMETLSLRYPEAEWHLEHPAHLRLAERLELEKARLVSGTQPSPWRAGNRGRAVRHHLGRRSRSISPGSRRPR